MHNVQVNFNYLVFIKGFEVTYHDFKVKNIKAVNGYFITGEIFYTVQDVVMDVGTVADIFQVYEKIKKGITYYLGGFIKFY